MPFEQTITVINNSGKIISTGKHLVGIFKEARTAYKEKKEALKQEHSGKFRRAHTYDGNHYGSHHDPIVEEYDDGRYDQYDDYHRHHRALGYSHAPLFLDDGHRLSLDDGDRRSFNLALNQRRHRPQRSNTTDNIVSSSDCNERGSIRPPLTTSNLRTLTEVSATRQSVAPLAYRRSLNSYAETGPRDVILSPTHVNELVVDARSPTATGESPESIPPTSMMVHRPRPDPALSRNSNANQSVASSKPIDMNLAYGSIPPDLASRADLGLVTDSYEETSVQKESQARTLMDRIESILIEAQCIHHTAASIICHLQDNPEAAAAVALALAELSTLLTKLSPAFLSVVKCGSPAIFALLASPQFLIGTSIAVGVTVVIFGGWKIIKRISEVCAAREEEKQAVEANEQASLQNHQNPSARPSPTPPANNRASVLTSVGCDEALVLEEELSSIEYWRRGIVAPLNSEPGFEHWDGTEADVELISPEAMRSRIDLDVGRTARSVRTRQTTKSQSRHSSISEQKSTHKGKKPKAVDLSLNVPERHSSKVPQIVNSQNRRGDIQCSRSQRYQRNEARSEAGVSGSSRYSGRSRRRDSNRHSGSKGSGRPLDRPPSSVTTALDTGSSQSIEKKLNGTNMLKQLFKKRKDKEAKEHGNAVASVLA